jgi:hypothetical protein
MTAAVWGRDGRRAFWALAGGLGVAEAFAGRNAMNADGISYLDIADAYGRGDWGGALSLYWSPLYSWLVGGALALARPSAAWEFPLVHLVNLAIYGAALAALELLVRELAAWRAVVGAPGPLAGPAWAWRAWAYAAFLTAALDMVTLRLVTPDLLLLAAVLAVAGLLCRIAAGRAGPATFVALGVVLGLAYLAKLAAVSVALVALVAAAIVAGAGRRRALVAALALVAVAGPWVVALSLASGRPTLGTAGALNYQWIVNREPGVRMEVAHSGFVASGPAGPRPTRLVEAPPTYGFDGPVPGTVPLWREPGYWHAGAAVHVSPGRQARAVGANLARLAEALLAWVPSVAGLGVLLAAGRRAGTRPGPLPRFLVALGGIPLVMYLAVYVERRYVAAFLVVLALAAFAAVRLPDRPAERRRLAAVCLVVLAAQTAWPAARITYDVAHEVKGLTRGDPALHRHWTIARGLAALGVAPGDRVAVLGDFFSAGWARLARVRVTAAIDPFPGAIVATGAPDADRLGAALTAAGVRAVVSDGPPRGVADLCAWTPLADRHTHACVLGPAPRAGAMAR